MAEPIALSTINSTPDPKIIDQLEWLLAEAKAGRIRAFAAVLSGPYDVGCVISCGDRGYPELLGTIKLLETKILDEWGV